MGQNTFMRNSESRGEVADSRALQTQENPREREDSSLTMTTVALGAPSKGDKRVSRILFPTEVHFIRFRLVLNAASCFKSEKRL